jgi:lipopolysaccharide export system permease protein
MIKKIDWYILRKFIGTFVFILILLLLITIVIDVSEKIDGFLGSNVPFKDIVTRYYAGFIPFIGAILTPFFVLVSVIFFTSQLAERSEIIAILNSGTSFYRFLYPYFLGASILAVSLWYANNYLVPASNKKRVDFENQYINKYINNITYNFHRQISPGLFMYVENYRPSDGLGYKFSLDRFDKGNLVYKLRSEKIEWDSTHHKWHIFNYYTRTITSTGDVIRTGAQLDTVLPVNQEMLSIVNVNKDQMSTPMLNTYIDRMRKGGMSNIEYYEVERYRRDAGAFSIFIMTLIGVSLASRRLRGGLGWHLVLGIALCSIFEIIGKFSITFSINSTLPPVIGVWVPNMIFGVLAIVLLYRAPK